MLTATDWSTSAIAPRQSRSGPLLATPPRSGLGETPTKFLTAARTTAAGAGVTAAAAMVARALARSGDPTTRVVGYGVGALAALTGTGTAALLGTQVANDITYQRRMEAVGQKYGFTPQSRGERFRGEIKEVRQKARGEEANYDRPLDGKPIAEAGLPDRATHEIIQPEERACTRHSRRPACDAPAC